MSKHPELEICCHNWLSAKTAEDAGADRIELCSAIGEGGLTPSAGIIIQSIQQLSLKTHVLIRPRSGDFLYSDEEIEIMKRDVIFCKENGVDGVVFGFLKADGSVDKELTKEFVDLAQPMKTTFHRAFDMCSNPIHALDELISVKVDYLLTSGQQGTAMQGAKLIKQLAHHAKGKLVIMAASGVRAHLLKDLIEKSQAGAYHLSARIDIDSQMKYRKTAVSMGSQSLDAEYTIQSQNIEDLKKAKEILFNL